MNAVQVVQNEKKKPNDIRKRTMDTRVPINGIRSIK